MEDLTTQTTEQLESLKAGYIHRRTREEKQTFRTSRRINLTNLMNSQDVTVEMTKRIKAINKELEKRLK